MVNKMPFFSLICDECDILAAARSGCPSGALGERPLNDETILGIGEIVLKPTNLYLEGCNLA